MVMLTPPDLLVRRWQAPGCLLGARRQALLGRSSEAPCWIHDGSGRRRQAFSISGMLGQAAAVADLLADKGARY